MPGRRFRPGAAPWNDLWSTDIVDQDAKVAFSMFFGSHFGDWTRTDNLLRSVLAAPTLGLAACLAGLPHWFCHHLALGEPLGYAARLSMNNSSLYQNQSNALARAVFVNLLGDPTLRMESVAPPSALSASTSAGNISLSWSPSVDPVLGYHVYRSSSPQGPFLRLTASPIVDTSYSDAAPLPLTPVTYMVRAFALQVNPSGSYFNPSQGVFVQLKAGAAAVAISATSRPGGVELNWGSRSNAVYHVEATASLQAAAWTNISGQIVSRSTVSVFVDTNLASSPARFYRVVSE